MHGFSTALSNGWALASSHQKDIEGKQSMGSVTFYKQSDGRWLNYQEIIAPNAENFANFGMSLAIDGTTAVISAIGDHEKGVFSGAAYIYHFNYSSNLWEFDTKLTASDGATGHRFGQTVAINEGLILVGTHLADGNASKSGAAYVFEKINDTWTETQKIWAKNGKTNDYFAHKIHILDANTLAIGAYNADGQEERSGVVYVFTKDTQWAENSVLSASDGKSSDLFGFSLTSGASEGSLIDDILFIGAPGTNNDNGQTGSVFLFHKSENTWSENYELIENTASHNDHFGTSISYNKKGNLFVSASRAKKNELKGSGKVYIYENISLDDSSIKSGTEFKFADSATYDHFGTSISSDYENLIVASPYATEDDKTNSGNVHFFRYTSVIEGVDVEQLYSVKQNFPNPFTKSTVIEYTIKKTGRVKINLYNTVGLLVNEIVNEVKDFGTYTVTFKGAGLRPGIYFYKFEINGYSSNKRMVFVK